MGSVGWKLRELVPQTAQSKHLQKLPPLRNHKGNHFGPNKYCSVDVVRGCYWRWSPRLLGYPASFPVPPLKRSNCWPQKQLQLRWMVIFKQILSNLLPAASVVPFSFMVSKSSWKLLWADKFIHSYVWLVFLDVPPNGQHPLAMHQRPWHCGIAIIFDWKGYLWSPCEVSPKCAVRHSRPIYIGSILDCENVREFDAKVG